MRLSIESSETYRNAEWVAGDTSSIAEWDYDTTSGVAYHKVWRQKQLEFSEESDQANWVSMVSLRSYMFGY